MEVHPPPGFKDFMPVIAGCDVYECIPPVKTSSRHLISLWSAGLNQNILLQLWILLLLFLKK
jgi:hypothetical protein